MAIKRGPAPYLGQAFSPNLTWSPNYTLPVPQQKAMHITAQSHATFRFRDLEAACFVVIHTLPTG